MNERGDKPGNLPGEEQERDAVYRLNPSGEWNDLFYVYSRDENGVPGVLQDIVDGTLCDNYGTPLDDETHEGIMRQGIY